MLVILVGMLLSIAVKMGKSYYTSSLDDDDSLGKKTQVASLLVAAVISLTNLALQFLLPMLTRREAYGTHIMYETMVFSKLATAYIFNTTFVPFLLGLMPVGLTQAWYEDGGVVTQSLYMMVGAGIGFPLTQITQPFSVLMRHWKGRREAVSQSQLDRLWTPPRFQFAQHYASTLKALSLCLVYAPLYPPAYLITSVLLFFAYACYKGALKMWYHKPRPLKELLCDRMVAFVVWVLLPAHIVVSWDAQNKARQDADSIWSKVPSSWRHTTPCITLHSHSMGLSTSSS